MGNSGLGRRLFWPVWPLSLITLLAPRAFHLGSSFPQMTWLAFSGC